MPDKERQTVPIDNVVAHADQDFWLNWLTRMSYEVYEPTDNLVQAHKDKFGRQTYCWTNTLEGRRFWVWEFEDYRIYVANSFGVQIEVDSEITDVEEGKRILSEYLEAWE